MESLFSTPDMQHAKGADFECVYEPAEDTFLMLDALEKEYENLTKIE
jgi:release factor glutamine methyltransferase